MLETIMGFSLQKACEDDLSLKHLLLMHYVKESFNSKKLTVNKIEYYQIKYKKVIEELPILQISTTRNIYKLLKDLVNKGYLLHHTDYASKVTASYYACTGKAKTYKWLYAKNTQRAT